MRSSRLLAALLGAARAACDVIAFGRPPNPMRGPTANASGFPTSNHGRTHTGT